VAVLSGLSPEVQIALVMGAFVLVCLAVVLIFLIISSPGLTRNFCTVVDALVRFIRRREPPTDPPVQDAA
jgi:hypothetical protein